MTTAARTGSRGPKHANYRATFVVLAAGVASYALMQSLVTPVLPTVQHDLHTTQNTVTWVLTAYLLAASVFTPIMGRLGDMHGKGRLFMVCLVALSVGSVIAAVAPNIGVLIFARAVQGIGGGALPLAFGIVRDEFPADRVAGAVGIVAALTAVGGGFGIALAGPIVDALNYHWLFWIPAIMTALAAVGTHLLVPPSPVTRDSKVNWTAGLTLSIWLVALLLAVSEGPVWGWGSASVLGLLAVALVVMFGWLYVELHAAHPLVDMKMMRLPAVWTVNLASLLFGVSLYSVFAFVPEFLQTAKSTGYGFGASITESGVIILPMSVFSFVFGVASGPAAKRFGGKAVLLGGSIMSAIGLGIITFFHNAIWQVVLSVSLFGVGLGFSFAAMSAIVVAAVPLSQTGVATGMNANIRTVGGGIGAGVMASIVTSGTRANGLPTNAGYTHSFLFLTISSILAICAAALVPTLRRDRDVPPLNHPELGLVAAGTLSGDEPE